MNQYAHTILVVLLTVAMGAEARDWASYSSENFTLYSDQRPKQVIELLKEFEVFRAVAFTAIGLEPRPSHSKMKIMLYARTHEYRDIGPKNSLGFYYNTTAGPRMVVGPGRGSTSRAEILYHEYIHYLMREHSEAIYPRWYNEGMAEVLGATTISRGKATIGAVPTGRANTINYSSSFKVRDLLEPDQEDDSRNYQARFYAYSWLFTHYLQISSLRDNPHLRPKTSDFLQRYNLGEPAIEAFTNSFGRSPEDMDKEIRKYRGQRSITVMTMPVNDYEGDIIRQELKPGEENFLLADIAWRVGKEDVALDYLEDLEVTNPDYAQSLSLAAVLENHKDNTDLAASYANRALAMAPKDPQVLTNYAHWLADNRSRLKETTPEQELNTLTQQQVDYTNQATSIDPNNLEALRFLWSGQLELGEDIEALKTMMAAYQVSPSNLGINLTVGRHLLDLQRGDLAIPFLERVMSWSHSTEQRQRIKSILDQIENTAEQVTDE